MKKVMFFLAVSLFVMSCGGSADQAAVDSTSEQVVIDSVVAEDSAAVAEDTAQLVGSGPKVEHPIK